MKIPLKAIVIIVAVCAAVGFLKSSGIGDAIVDFFYNPGGAVDGIVPDVNINP